MKEISLRKAKLDDLEIYKNLYEDYDAMFLYSNHDEDDEKKAKEDMKGMGIDEELQSKDFIKEYQESIKSIYFITVNQNVVGYIKADKKGKELVIHDMAISDYSLWNERNLCKLFNVVFNETKTEKIVIYYCVEITRKMLQRIGFTSKGYLEKIAGI